MNDDEEKTDETIRRDNQEYHDELEAEEKRLRDAMLKNKNDWKNTDGICDCKNKYSITTHGNGYALMFAMCQHRHGYNLANMREVDFPMIKAMLLRLNHSEAILHGQK